jgi:hypothetical protein
MVYEFIEEPIARAVQGAVYEKITLQRRSDQTLYVETM